MYTYLRTTKVRVYWIPFSKKIIVNILNKHRISQGSQCGRAARHTGPNGTSIPGVKRLRIGTLRYRMGGKSEGIEGGGQGGGFSEVPVLCQCN